MSETDLEKLANDYLIEKFGSKYGNGSAKQAFIDGCKIALGINPVSGLLSIEDIKKAVYQFKKEELPDAEVPFHYEAEIWAGMKSFIRWLEAKQQ